MSRYYMMNKAWGDITARSDPDGRPVVLDRFPEELRSGLHPVGRLDRDTEGLLLFTDDGMFDVFLMRPEKHVEKEYEYLAFGKLEEDIFPRMEEGIRLPSGELCKPARGEILGYTTVGACEFLIAEERRAHYMKNAGRPVTRGIIRVTEGKRHQVKLMVRALGGRVFRLKRNAIGPLQLDSSLRGGEYRPLTPEELALLGYPSE